MAPCLALLLAALLLGCSGSSSDDGGGGIVGFVSGSEAPGAVPSDGSNPAAPVIGSVSATSSTIENGQPLRIEISFTDEQGDVATVHFGVSGQTTHSTLSADIVGTKTSGALTLDLYPKKYTPGTYTLLVSMTDKAGHTSMAASLVFTIAGSGGKGDSDGGFAGDASSEGDADGSIGRDAGADVGGGVGHESYLLKMESVRGVSMNPPVPTTFTLASPSYITRVWTYHYNATIGTKSPTVAVKDTTTGAVYGPWVQTGYKSIKVELDVRKSDPGDLLGPPDNYWVAYPGAAIPAGTYQVVDSDPATWAYTDDLGKRGIAWVYGWAGGAPTGDAGARTQPDAAVLLDGPARSDGSITTGDTQAGKDATTLDASATQPWSTPILVEQGEGVAGAAKLAIDPNGTVFAVWEQKETASDSSPSRVYANSYAPGSSWGTPTRLDATELGVNSPIITADDNGHVMVVWRQALPAAGSYDLYSSLYSPGSGWSAPAPVVIPTLDGDKYSAEPPTQMVFDGSGNGMVTWPRYEKKSNLTGACVTYYHPSSGWGETEVIGPTDPSSYEPRIGMDVQGNATVIWYQFDATAGGLDVVHARRYSPATKWGLARSIDTKPRGRARPAQVVTTSDGGALAVWTYNNEPGFTFNRFAGADWGQATTVVEPADSVYAGGAQVLLDPSGKALVVWNVYGGPVRSVWIGANGSVGAIKTMASDGSNLLPDVVLLPGGEVLAVLSRNYATNYGVWWSRLSSADEWSAPAKISPPDSSKDSHLVVDQTGNATVVWLQSHSLYSSTARF